MVSPHTNYVQLWAWITIRSAVWTGKTWEACLVITLLELQLINIGDNGYWANVWYNKAIDEGKIWKTVYMHRISRYYLPLSIFALQMLEGRCLIRPPLSHSLVRNGEWIVLVESDFLSTSHLTRREKVRQSSPNIVRVCALHRISDRHKYARVEKIAIWRVRKQRQCRGINDFQLELAAFF